MITQRNLGDVAALRELLTAQEKADPVIRGFLEDRQSLKSGLDELRDRAKRNEPVEPGPLVLQVVRTKTVSWQAFWGAAAALPKVAALLVSYAPLKDLVKQVTTRDGKSAFVGERLAVDVAHSTDPDPVP